MLTTLIEEHTKQNKITKEAFARSLGITYQHINHIEKNKRIPSVSLILSMAKTFDMPPGELFDTIAMQLSEANCENSNN